MATIGVDRILAILEARVKGATQVKQLEKVMEDIDQSVKQTNKTLKNQGLNLRNIQNVLLSTGLSFLFTGMAIKRFFQGILTSLFQTFLMAEGETGRMNETVNALMARLAALKFAFFDAFIESGILDKWIDRLERLVGWFESLDESTKATAVEIALLGVILGAALMVIGQMALGVIGLISLFGFLAANPVVLLIAGFGLLILIIALLVRKVGGFGNFFKAVLRGIINLIAVSAQIFVESWVDAINFVIKMYLRLLNMLPESIRPTRITNALANSNIRAPDIVGATRSFNERHLGLPTDNNSKNVTVNVQGNVLTENQLLEFIKKGINNDIMFNTGSPQRG